MDAAENALRQGEEIEALQAIYGEAQVAVHRAPSGGGAGSCFDVRIPTGAGGDSGAGRLRASLRVTCPAAYPSHDAPVLEVRAAWLTAGDHARFSREMGQIYAESGGEVVVYSCVEHLREAMELNAPEGGAEAVPEPRQAATAPPPPAELVAEPVAASRVECPPIFHGEVLVDRKSTFQAHAARVETVGEVRAVMAELLSDRKIAKATHNIMAYRVARRDGSGLFLADNDEDGEQAAGGRLAHLLDIMDARDVVVVVSRWFGGILLGPDRFKHINNCARVALEAAGLVAGRSAR